MNCESRFIYVPDSGGRASHADSRDGETGGPELGKQQEGRKQPVIPLAVGDWEKTLEFLTYLRCF